MGYRLRHLENCWPRYWDFGTITFYESSSSLSFLHIRTHCLSRWSKLILPNIQKNKNWQESDSLQKEKTFINLLPQYFKKFANIKGFFRFKSYCKKFTAWNVNILILAKLPLIFNILKSGYKIVLFKQCYDKELITRIVQYNS